MKPTTLQSEFSMKPFEDLGRKVEESWRGSHYSDGSFAAIATTALNEADFLKKITSEQILSWVITSPVHPQQQDTLGRFGQPPITLFYGPRFCIDVYFWMASTTTIHDHGFSGAFTVLQGSSVQTRFRFSDRVELNPHFFSGHLVCEGAEMLRPGDVKTITPGDEFIHSVFHLEHPSVTLCIRTIESRTHFPQCDFYPPYFARSPFYLCPVRNKRVAAIQTLAGMGHPQCDEIVCETLATSDFQTAFEILRTGWMLVAGNSESERLQTWLRVVRQRHPKLADQIIPTFAEIQRQGILVRRRSMVTKKEHRFFLAVFLTITDRQAMLNFVKQEYPESEPAKLLTSWLAELSKVQISGSPEDNVLGIAGIGRDYLSIFESLLCGHDHSQILQKFRQVHSEDYVEEFKGTLEPLIAEIKSTDIFAPQLNS